MFDVLLQQLPWFSARRDAEARYTRILHTYGAGLRRVVFGYFPDATKAERDDLEQEIALALWKALPAFRGDCSERTFVYRVAHNRCITQRKRRKVPVDRETLPDTLLDPTPNAEHEVGQRQAYIQLHAAVATLPLKYRQVVMLALEGMNHAEISDVVGISSSNVAVRLHRAQPMLRACLSKEDIR